MINPDLITNHSSEEAAKCVYALVDRLQDFRPETQVLSTALLFYVLCRVLKEDHIERLRNAGNLMSDPIHGVKTEFRALEHYIKGELQ